MLTDKNNQAPAQTQQFKLGYGDYLRFRDLVLERSGLYFPEKKRADLETGLFKALAETLPAAVDGKYDLEAYYQLLKNKGNPGSQAAMERLMNTLTIGETYFFRDEAQFNALATRVLPELITRKRAAAKAVGQGIKPQLRIWSAGCSSGEEPYSIAILIKELIPDLDNWHILILATDINQQALARARQAIYSDWSFRETKAKALRATYFSPESNNGSQARPIRYRLREDICRMVTFASLNLMEDTYPAIHNNTVSMDLILCRNVTIYFTENITKQVVQRFYQTLVEGGWLVVGHSEPSLVIYRNFEARTFPDTFFYQKTGRGSRWPDDWDWLHAPAKTASPGSGSHLNGQGIQSQKKERVTKPLPPRNVYTTLPHRSSEEMTAPPPPSPEAVCQKATELLEQGRIEEAVTHLKGLLADRPDYAPAHSLLGRAYANQARWTEAHQACRRAIELDNLQAEAYYVMASIYQHQNQFEGAIEMFKKTIYLDRQLPLPHFNLALLYQKAGQLDRARRACQNVIQILEKWPPEKIVPDSGGATAQNLSIIARRILEQLE